MKTRLLQILLLAACFYSCDKDEEDSFDYRNAIIGEYKGTRVDSQMAEYGGTITSKYSLVTINLTKSESDSIIIISLIPGESKYPFKYSKEKFKSTQDYRPPKLSLTGDSLYFFYQPGIGPVWMECFTKKVN